MAELHDFARKPSPEPEGATCRVALCTWMMESFHTSFFFRSLGSDVVYASGA
jgi:hypothetical protein